MDNLKIPRYLITTADEKTWKFDRPVIFLGEWCRIYERKSVWLDMDAIVAVPYGLDPKQKDMDFAEACALEQYLFDILLNVLNQVHGTNHSARFWRIVLGHWLRRFVNVIINRVRSLEMCIQCHDLSGTTSFSIERFTLAPLNSDAAIWAYNDNLWNNYVYTRILELLNRIDFPLEEIATNGTEELKLQTKTTGLFFKRRVIKAGYQFVRRIVQLFVQNQDGFIINSYLPKIREIKLQLTLGQVPPFWVSPKLPTLNAPDPLLRQKLSNQVKGKTNDALYEIACSLVFEFLPVCYLEGFEELNESIQQLSWPKNPRFIFTSNSFDSDEVFKHWLANKVESGFYYIVGQHGNNYGTSRYANPMVEEETADKFLTWGWTDGLQQHAPAFILTTTHCKKRYYKTNGGLLLIELFLTHRNTTWDNTFEFVEYFQNQQKFIDGLGKLPRNQITVRLHGGFRSVKWCDEKRWKDFDPNLRIDTGGITIWKLISQSRLVIHSYDSTGLLETLSRNIPTLAFWENGFDHLRESAKPYYQLLIDAGIVHFTADSAAAKVNEVWNNVENWWEQRLVQDARQRFCDRYAKKSENPVRDLKKLLID